LRLSARVVAVRVLLGVGLRRAFRRPLGWPRPDMSRQCETGVSCLRRHRFEGLGRGEGFAQFGLHLNHVFFGLGAFTFAFVGDL
jgi:hypothetical protein